MHLDPRTIILLSIASGTGLLQAVFNREELSPRQGRIEQIVGDEIVGKAVKEAIKAMRTAVVAP